MSFGTGIKEQKTGMRDLYERHTEQGAFSNFLNSEHKWKFKRPMSWEESFGASNRVSGPTIGSPSLGSFPINYEGYPLRSPSQKPNETGLVK
jgi:hypothetical protein